MKNGHSDAYVLRAIQERPSNFEPWSKYQDDTLSELPRQANVTFRRKQRSAFDQVSKFDRGRIVAYRDCGLSFREISSRVGRNQTTVMRICDRWMQEMSARTIRRRLQQSGLSAKRPLLALPVTQNHRRLRRQWCDERRLRVAEWNEVVFTDESRICLEYHDGRIQVGDTVDRG
ncbi:transposable element Tc1 transposase [Trichonephila clavipes]|nr:transposable element Tc1 transposase [Trichonephila clavipes]